YSIPSGDRPSHPICSRQLSHRAEDESRAFLKRCRRASMDSWPVCPSWYICELGSNSLIWSWITRCSRRRARTATNNPGTQWIIRQRDMRTDLMGRSERVAVYYREFSCKSDILGKVNVQWLTRLGNVAKGTILKVTRP